VGRGAGKSRRETLEMTVLLCEKLYSFSRKPLPNQLNAITAAVSQIGRTLPVTRPLARYLEQKRKNFLFGDLAPLVPAVADMFDGPQSLRIFKQNGDEYLQIYRNICGLQPDEQMLDVGCGIGRKTIPLTSYLSENGSYTGIDIISAGIDWRSRNISSRFPNFKFFHIDVRNEAYNPDGIYAASQFKFPFADQTFDLVVLGSVFTHMLPNDLKNYLSETHRVLKSSGRCLISYFLLNDESLKFLDKARGDLDFRYEHDQYRTISDRMPELAIAFDEDWIIDLYRKVGLAIARTGYGSWCKRPNYLSYQDLVLAEKRGR
jgi:SAM-dependent methyltransferase